MTRDVTAKVFRASFSIKEFCHRHGISRSTYYQIRDDGVGPAVFHIGKSVRISREAEKKWMKRMGAHAPIDNSFDEDSDQVREKTPERRSRKHKPSSKGRRS